MVTLVWVGNFISYRWIKNKVLLERRWDYNICCGTTDGGGINADIVRHRLVPNYESVEDVSHLPHADHHFNHVLCSHTLEHVDDPVAMYRELRRVGKNVTILVPPLWDLAGALNPFEHRVIFLTFRSRHGHQLPNFVPYTFGRWVQRHVGQWVRADMWLSDSTPLGLAIRSKEGVSSQSTASTESRNRHPLSLARFRAGGHSFLAWSSFFVPATWALSAWTLHAESRLGFLFLAAALIALWVDQVQSASLPARIRN